MHLLARIVATSCTAAACAASAQVGYQWTDITPSFGGLSDAAHVRVRALGIHVLDGNRLIVTGAFWPGGEADTLSPPYSMMSSDDAGRTWNVLPSPAGSLFVDVARPGVVYVVRDSRVAGVTYFGSFPASTGSLYRSEDFGRTWSEVYTIPVGESVFPIAPDPLDSHGLYAFYEESYIDAGGIGFPLRERNPGITRTHDDGYGWSVPLAAPAGFYLKGPTPSAPTRLFTGSNDGTFVSVDSGATWSRMQTAPSPLTWVTADPLRSNVLYGYSQKDGYRLLRSDDAGTTWREIFHFYSTPVALNLTIDPAHPDVLWMPYGLDGIYRSGDRGESWQVLRYPFMNLPANYDPGATLVASPAEPGVVYLLRFDRLFRGVPIAAPDPVVAEFEYEGNRYWLTSLGGEAVSQDYRQQPGNAHRTGLRWGAWRADDAPAGALGSCRFWSKPESGLRTRVLVLQGFECDVLKGSPGWLLEAENEFYAVPPVNDACPSGLVAVRRFHNTKADANHRWVADAGVAGEMRARGWYDEGVRFCARPLGENE